MGYDDSWRIGSIVMATKPIDMVEKNGIFVPVRKNTASLMKSEINSSNARVPSEASARKGRKGLARPQNLEPDIGKIFSDIVGDFFKIVKKEMFR